MSLTVPSEMEFFEFFGVDPVERSIEDGYWCYEVVDERHVALRFSFNIFHQSVQTTLQVAGTPLTTVAHEGAEIIQLSGDTLTCRFKYR